jgi:hypothetical protein
VAPLRWLAVALEGFDLVFGLLRFLAGLGLGGVLPTALVLINEYATHGRGGSSGCGGRSGSRFWMTSMLHRFSDASDFDLRRQIAELELVTSSPTAATTLTQHYTGLPLG